jgi:Na+/H+ antiporter NhaA
MANDVGIRLTKSQKEKVDKFLRSGQNQGMVVGKPIAVFAASTNGKIKICKK